MVNIFTRYCWSHYQDQYNSTEYSFESIERSQTQTMVVTLIFTIYV